MGRHAELKGFLYNGSLVCFTFFLPLLTFTFLLIGAAINYYLGDLYFGHFLLLAIALPSTICIFYMLSGKTLVTEVKGVFSALSVSLEAGRKQVGRIGRERHRLSICPGDPHSSSGDTRREPQRRRRRPNALLELLRHTWHTHL